MSEAAEGYYVTDAERQIAALQQRVERLEAALRAAHGIIHEGLHGGRATDPEHQARCERLACRRIRAALADAGPGVADAKDEILASASDQLANTVALLNSMVLSGESHSDTSRKVMQESLAAYRMARGREPS